MPLTSGHTTVRFPVSVRTVEFPFGALVCTCVNPVVPLTSRYCRNAASLRLRYAEPLPLSAGIQPKLFVGVTVTANVVVGAFTLANAQLPVPGVDAETK